MANVYDHNGMDGSFNLADLSTNDYLIGAGSDEMVSTLLLHIVVSSGTISMVPKARANQKDAKRNGDDAALLPIPFTRRALAGAVSDDTTVSAAIVATGIFKVDITGLEAWLSVTQTSGVGKVYWKVVQGAAA